MTRTTKKGNLWFLVELTFKWYEAAMVFHIFTFIFLVLEPTVKKEHLDENDFHHSYGNYFESAIMKVI